MPTQPVRILRILSVGSHCIEFLADGSVDIVSVDIEQNPDEYTHLTGEEAYLLFAALHEQYKTLK